MSDALLTGVAGGVVTLTLNRPHRRNAIDADLAAGLLAALRAAAADDSVRCVVLTGAGGHFSVGGDLQAGSGGVAVPTSPDQVAAEIRQAGEISELLAGMPKPTVAAIRGSCAGAGLSLACAADLRVAAAGARFSTAFATAGVSGDFGATWTVPRIVGRGRARELFLLAEKFDAGRALELGLVSQVCADDELDGHVAALAGRLAGMAPLALAALKANLDDAERLALGQHLDAEARRHAETALTDDAGEAAAAFLDKRPPQFTGR